MAENFLLVIGDREPLAWVLTEERMAFTTGRASLARRLTPGDRLFLYTTRGCFRNPTRDRGRVIGEATVKTTVTTLEKPVEFGDLAFPLGCHLHITGLAARAAGVQLGTMLDKLHLFPDPKTWSVRLRQVLVPIDAHDATLLHGELASIMQPSHVHRPEYLSRYRSAATDSASTPA